MKDERKEFDEQQSYLPKSSQEMINLREERNTTNETIANEPMHDDEHYSALEGGTLAESDIAKQAHRRAANYVRSLLLF
ncbi:hypothetical protein FXV77_14705 [Sphingobacterium phlebotomi]|uniref:Uncharacterized protein n=1 Tax=Sphingobacterium phlebotomi TaxID=2605433 RepID=A0A5D4H272_9SPHI|nr:hypothetical protein [Sphingobacterium phlebotomi]TYR34718.1 hypothetical protein FXV77_14705 [Sphingobacterium phlebotomi]